ncbi:MAG: M20/M25/M40 family metallo-hydrolase [Deltaproteobacteria bacterium]|nr:M20/M25/M40 family metallo-hydrolase [Deltaproteobacteria bacterium]
MERAVVEKIYQEHEKRFIEEWKEFLRFKSISTEPDYEQDCRKCAEWLVSHLRSIGFEASLLETPSKPTVYGFRKGTAGHPRVLYYGHYDVQPFEPRSEWKSDPFDPELRNGRLFARGAMDNKGQTFYVLKALEQLIKHDALKSDVTVLIEGEEEGGSEGFMAALAGWKDKLKADVLMVCDTGTLAPGVPAITMGLRAIGHLTIKLGGIHKDLHSGVHGGMVKNPATEMCRLIASLHNPDGSIAVKNYYDGVKEAAAEDRALANRMPITMEQYAGMVGVPPLGGEANYTPLERRGFRPCIDVNGIHSGYDGPGSKTIIPSFAIAKISARIVAGQDPKRCVELISQHLKAHAPKGLNLEVEGAAGPGRAVSLSSKSEIIQKARQVLLDVSGQEPLFMWEGSSIPVVSVLSEITGAEPLLVGFGVEEDNMHAPNESFSLTQFKDGFMYASMMFGSF